MMMTTANHNPAHTILYGAEDFKGMKIWTIKHSSIYLITYATKQKNILFIYQQLKND